MPTQRLEIEVIVDEKGAITGIKRISNETDKARKNEENGRKKTLFGLNKIKLAYAAVAAVIGGVVVKAIGSLIRSARDAEETFSKFGTVFKSVTAQAEKSATLLAQSYGLSSVKAKQLLADTGDLLSGFGFTGAAALDLSTQVNELAVDLASFTNFSGGAAGASAALTKAILGERESAKSLGIAIQEADVQARVFQLTQQNLF